MKGRAIILLALIIGGFTVMLKSLNELEEYHFSALLEDAHLDYNVMTFTKPPLHGLQAETWVVNREQEIDELLVFLQHYRIRKVPPSELQLENQNQQFSIRLSDANGNEVMILIDENLIIQNSLLHYEIINGPLDVDWLVEFFVSSKKS